jgi:hypothetical protein
VSMRIQLSQDPSQNILLIILYRLFPHDARKLGYTTSPSLLTACFGILGCHYYSRLHSCASILTCPEFRLPFMITE